MNVLLTCLILAANPSAPIADRFPDTVEVFHCGFEESADRDYDDWPDGWTRRRGLGYPHYLNIKIRTEPNSKGQRSPEGQRCLRINLNGGGAAIYSLPIEIGPRYNYVLEGMLKTEGLKFDEAFFTVVFLDEKRQPIETCTSDKRRLVKDWTKVRLGPVSCTQMDARYAMIGLHVEPAPTTASALEQPPGMDLQGAALFDDIWLGRLPQLLLEIDDSHSLYVVGQKIHVLCQLSGFSETDPRVKLELEDALGRKLAEVERPLVEIPNAAPLVEGSIGVARLASTSWEPPVREIGFYRVRASMPGHGTFHRVREQSFTVLESHLAPPHGEFGWSLPRGEEPMQLPELARLLGQVGIRWVKFPVWYAEEDLKRADALIQFSDQLETRGIELVGLLHNPPPAVRRKLALSESPVAANIFTTDPAHWYPALEPVQSRLAFRVQAWQLGQDDDTSFVGYHKLSEKIAVVKKHLDRIGQNVHLVLGWGWLDQEPMAKKAPWRFLSMSADPSLTPQELATYLQAGASRTVGHWIHLRPLDRDEYDTVTRAADLVLRMTEAKAQGAAAIFLLEPFNDRRGVMNEDGTPGELLLPWRTTAVTLSGMNYAGNLDLASGSQNRLFTLGDKAVLVVWSDTPRQEVMYLGENARQVDVWGRSMPPVRKGDSQVFEIGPLPTFITGVSEAIARWRIEFALEKPRLPSIFGLPHANSFRLKNTFGHRVSGRIKLVMPENWRISPDSFDFALGAGEELHQSFEVMFPFNASSGEQPVRIDFDVAADHPYRFSAYRTLEVGLGDVVIELSGRLNVDGDLELEQRLTNRSDREVSFRCQLLAPNRRRIRSQVMRLPQGEDVQTYRLRNGEDLIGQTIWVRAEEIGGSRTLNYKYVVEPAMSIERKIEDQVTQRDASNR